LTVEISVATMPARRGRYPLTRQVAADAVSLA